MIKKIAGLSLLLVLIGNLGLGEVEEANSKPDIDRINVVNPEIIIHGLN